MFWNQSINLIIHETVTSFFFTYLFILALIIFSELKLTSKPSASYFAEIEIHRSSTENFSHVIFLIGGKSGLRAENHSQKSTLKAKIH